MLAIFSHRNNAIAFTSSTIKLAVKMLALPAQMSLSSKRAK